MSGRTFKKLPLQYKIFCSFPCLPIISQRKFSVAKHWVTHQVSNTSTKTAWSQCHLLDKQEVSHSPNIWSSHKIWTIFYKITRHKQKYENSVGKGEIARTDDSYIWETVTQENYFYYIEYILLSQANNNAQRSWRLGWDGECNNNMCKNNFISLQVICFMTWPLYHHATAIILHIRYMWKHLLLTVLNNDWHFFLSMYDMGRASGMYGGKRKMHARFQQGSLNKRNHSKT